MSFFDEFNQIIPYSVSVNVGKNKQFITDPSKKSDTNHKGKMVNFYKKAETLEELEKHGLGQYMTYLPAEEVSMPGEDIAFQSITQFSKDENTPKLKSYVASCVVDETERSKRGGNLFPNECAILENDLLAYQQSMAEFQQHMEWFKKETGIDVSIEKCIDIGNLSYDEQERQGFSSPQFNVWYYSSLANYLSDQSNNILKNFKGNYIGNILRLTDNGYEACIVTKHQKSNKNYRLYTLIDLTGTSIAQGTGIDYLDEERDPHYFERLRNADKTPTFVTELNQDGTEKLILHKGDAISEQCPEYDDFVKNFMTPFSEIKPIQIGKILNRENKMTR